MDNRISYRGVYYDLTISPYEYNTPYGEVFKFPSAKKLEIYSRDIKDEISRADKFLNRHNLQNLLPDEVIELFYKSVYRSFYKKVVG